MSIDARLTELGIELPEAPLPLAVYVPAVVEGNLVFISGQLPTVNGELRATGKVGEGNGLVAPADAKDYARTAALNGLAVIKSAIGNLDRITRIVKVTGFVACVPEFTAMGAVMNGASELLGDVFGDIGTHARSSIGVPVLPMDSPVEVEMIVAFK
jgi:enamine deaminase RidA (YjgF/YER057c/UK114 family)